MLDSLELSPRDSTGDDIDSPDTGRLDTGGAKDEPPLRRYGLALSD
jgi:hypothetical protein